MTEPLGWIHKRDGRLVPFEPDKISRALFGATESLGRADAFLAHELTDGILHFLAAEVEGGIPTTAQVAETVAKVVRELGHPALSQAFVNHPHIRADKERQSAIPAEMGVPWAEIQRAVETEIGRDSLRRRLAGAALETYSLRCVFSSDLVAAHREGLLRLGNLDSPLELASFVLPPAAGPLAEIIIQAGEIVGDLLAIDSPEYHLAGLEKSAISHFEREVRLGVAAAGVHAVVNLNCAIPPSWAEELAEGPLFGDRPTPGKSEERAAVSDALLDFLLKVRHDDRAALRVDWHLGEADFLPESTARLQRVVRRAMEGGSVALVFDRPRRATALAEGLDRRHASTLMTVGLHLPRLAEQRQVGDNPLELLQKLGSLVRMAMSAGCQKREFLRRQTASRPALAEGFRLDRARLVLVPVGLEYLARRMAKCGLARGDSGADFGRQVVRRIAEVVAQDSQSRHLDVCIDGPAALEPIHPLPDVAGLTAWDEEAALIQQVRAAGLLHGEAGMGTAAILLPVDALPTVEEGVTLLRDAWRKTEINRLRFVRFGSSGQQQLAPWAKDPTRRRE